MVYHIDHFFICLVSDPLYLALDAHDRNLLLWVCLLHDVSKDLEANRKKDPLHPFHSAGETLKLFKRWNWLKNGSEADVNTAVEIITRAQKHSEAGMVQDNEYLPAILSHFLLAHWYH